MLDQNGAHISYYAQHCARKLQRIAKHQQQVHKATIEDGRCTTRKPALEDIEAARIHIFHPSMFGNTLDEIMLAQQDKFPNRQLPWIQQQLCEQVLHLKGQTQEGIFR